ncbi:hypothetical protein SDC9_205594 [bioreactor metagenome]|uniref:Uncharacterized protein n=1 Tax=bioreactor metagenome TaxID=1076179 RepID=A0A645J2I3_9ZZZZ
MTDKRLRPGIQAQVPEIIPVGVVDRLAANPAGIRQPAAVSVVKVQAVQFGQFLHMACHQGFQAKQVALAGAVGFDAFDQVEQNRIGLLERGLCMLCQRTDEIGGKGTALAFSGVVGIPALPEIEGEQRQAHQNDKHPRQPEQR